MKLTIKTVAMLVAASLASAGLPALAQSSTVTGSTTTLTSARHLTQQQMNELAQKAYIFTYPLVMNYRTMYAQSIKSGDFGQWLHLGVSSPKDTDIVTPNVDSPYSYVWLDVRSEPWVLTMPKIEKSRFYTSQWDDMWGYVLGNPGSVNDGNDGVSVLLAGPDWKGETPKGIKRVIRGESDFLGSLTRTQLMGDMSDLNNVKKIQQEYKVQPLSEYLGTAKPAPAAKLDFPEWKEGAEITPQYWEYVAFMLQHVKHNPADQKMYDALKQLGIGTDGKLDRASLSAEQKTALEQGITLAQKEMKDVGDKTKDASKLFGTREKLKQDYLTRAMGVYLGIFGNTTDQSFYYSLLKDQNGQMLDASKHDYVIKMAKAQLPPVKYFWSLTLYSLPQRLLVANSDNRYSFSNTTPGLVKGDDGSVTFYVSSKKPDDKSVNWLPAPEGPFWTVMRTYGPDKSILNGSWKAPEVKAVK
ncbi:DUF1254 domain-containing protein [Serratia proteamaculans]|uniref:DUF1254 domain-containing protein n=1 Tax=Serratia proteamaculans TaxID=28151 RepID=UPI001575694B|nr:DUF1254 domain-containing protein [Serratia proteamaculans]NTX78837.1 DUF1254 domain-containing protein [Serratia proteamaculans]NTZ26922.1 DUF1254 domain-containing protein [Serratia proteamaculans]